MPEFVWFYLGIVLGLVSGILIKEWPGEVTPPVTTPEPLPAAPSAPAAEIGAPPRTVRRWGMRLNSAALYETTDHDSGSPVVKVAPAQPVKR